MSDILTCLLAGFFMLKILPLILLMGCATTSQSLDDLMQEAVACSNAKVQIDSEINCDELWDTINLREEARERRLLRNAVIECPDDYVVFTNHWGDQGCMSRLELSHIMRDRW